MRMQAHSDGRHAALYYPSIHIRSEHWLKATLLCFPAVKRIVPDNYEPEDTPLIRRYTGIRGKNGPLLQAVSAGSTAAYTAQRRLLDRLQADPQSLEPFTKANAPNPDEYWIHDAKFNDDLLQFLQDRELAWHSEHSNPYGTRRWYALHPRLGSAVMTTLGLAIADEEELHVVTDSFGFHETLLATDIDRIFDVLVGHRSKTVVRSGHQMQQDLSEFVIALSGVNLQALRPEDLPELQECASFQSFQSTLSESTAAIDVGAYPDEYQAQLRAKAKEIVDAWNGVGGTISHELRNVLFENVAALGAGAGAAYLAGLGARDMVIDGGMAVGVVAYNVARTVPLFARRTRPYLAQVRGAQDSAVTLRFPLGLER